MPLYEYVCAKCQTRFEALRSASRMDDPALCPGGHQGAKRVLSTFSTVSGESSGEVEPTSGCGGGCSGCACGAN
jgi:putative FmdB family regulatory protein